MFEKKVKNKFKNFLNLFYKLRKFKVDLFEKKNKIFQKVISS